MTTSLRIQPAPELVRLTAKLDPNEELQLYHHDQPLSHNGDALELFLGSTNPVTLEIPDFQDAAGAKWTVTATGGTWTRGDSVSRSVWNETPNEIRVEVTASNGASAPRYRPIFIKVRPMGVKPWP
jgi:hypothetical protein